MENSKIIRKNPAGVYSPVGNYTHITKIPRNAELYVTSGQIGADPHGNIPDSMNEQIRNTFDNIRTVLHAEELSSEHIIKVNIWATQKSTGIFYMKMGRIVRPQLSRHDGRLYLGIRIARTQN